MAETMISPADINRRNDEYWQNRKRNAERLMESPHIVALAIERESKGELRKTREDRIRQD